MKDFEKIIKALADSNRLRILKILEHRKMSVCELAYILEVSQPSISRHLQKLKNVGFIKCEQDGFWTNCFLSVPIDIYGLPFSNLIKSCLNDDEIIKSDIKKAENINREDLRINNKCKGVKL